MSELCALGIDVGGTNTKIGVFTEQGTLLAKHSFPTFPVQEGASQKYLGSEIEKVLLDADVTSQGIIAVGLAVPGMIRSTDHPYLIPNVELDVKAYTGFLKEIFSQAKVSVINDANAAVLGDAWRGSAAENNIDNLVFVTLGTGVGTGIIINGNLVVGAHGAAGELGHLCVESAGGRLCNCGRRGCLETYASATGLIRTACELWGNNATEETSPASLTRAAEELNLVDLNRAIEEIDSTGLACAAEEMYPDAKAVFDAAASGDVIAETAVDSFTRYLAKGLVQLACVVDPALIIIGGGMAGSADVFLENFQTHFREQALSIFQDTPIIVSKLGNDCGIYGAVYHALILV